VVGHDDAESDAARIFVFLHAAPRPVEAIAFGGGAIVRADRHVESRVAARDALDGGQSGAVIGVDAGEDVVVVIVDGGKVAFEHSLDDGVLLPERNEDGDGALRFAAEGAPARPVKAATALEEMNEGDEEIVEPADQDPGRHGYQ